MDESSTADVQLHEYPLATRLLNRKQRKAIARLISRYHLKSPPYKSVYESIPDETSLIGYLKSLDKYSRFLTPEHVEFLETRESEFRIDLGLDYLVDEKGILAVPAPGGAAEAAGLTLPTRLVTINGNTIEYSDFTTYRFLTELTPGAEVRVVTNRPPLSGEKVYSITVTPRHRQLVMGHDLGDIGVIRIDRFASGQNEKLESLLKAFSQKRLLVIDLRYNPGGDLYAMVDNLSLLLPKDRVIAHVEGGRKGSSIPLKSLSGILLKPSQQVILLVSKYTASSAEIFAHAMKAHRHATLIAGQQTKGKCLAQERKKLSDGSALELTTHEVFSLNMQPCEGRPLVPDVVIADIDFMGLDIVSKIVNGQ